MSAGGNYRDLCPRIRIETQAVVVSNSSVRLLLSFKYWGKERWRNEPCCYYFAPIFLSWSCGSLNAILYKSYLLHFWYFTNLIFFTVCPLAATIGVYLPESGSRLKWWSYQMALFVFCFLSGCWVKEKLRKTSRCHYLASFYLSWFCGLSNAILLVIRAMTLLILYRFNILHRNTTGCDHRNLHSRVTIRS